MTNANNTTKNGNTTGSKRGKRRGFTLIEILIVVVILGVLAALVIPGVTGALGDANDKAALARASQISTMVTRYEQFNNQGLDTKSLADGDVWKVVLDADGNFVSETGKLSYLVTKNYCGYQDLVNQADSGKGWKWVAATKSFKPES